jgi:signal transduction histidine kinase/ligand-binding sensor domain-containing protein/DNA-binding response OmpR family regulator
MDTGFYADDFMTRSCPLVFLLTLCLGLTPLRAQQERVAFRHLTIADGLSQNAVQAILQDRRGFMWFGTKDGLNRYDGHEFVVFRHDPFDSTSISDSEITALYEDKAGRLWVGTRSGGVSRFDRSSERFQRYPSGPSRTVNAIAGDADGIWLGTDGEGLFRLKVPESDDAPVVVERFSHDSANPQSLGDDRVNAVVVDRRGDVWVGTEAGLDRLDRRASGPARFTKYRAGDARFRGLIDKEVASLYEDARGRLWVGSIPGVSVFDSARTGLTHFYHRYRNYRYGWGQALDMHDGGDGRLWIATASELMRLTPSTGNFEYFRHDPLDARSVNSDLPVAVYRDRSDVIWIGTNGFGLNLYDPKASRFGLFRRPPQPAGQTPSRIAGFSVYTLFEDAAGTIWIDAGLLYRWNRATGSFTSFESSSLNPDKFGNTGVWAIIEDPVGVLWAGTYRGLYRYEIATGRTRQYKHDPADAGGLPEEVAYDVFRDRSGTLWVVTENYLSKLTDPVAGRFTSYRHKEEPTTDLWTFPSTIQDTDGFLWLGSSQGLSRFDPATGSFRHYRSDPKRPTSLSHDAIRAILPDPREPKRYLWIGTAGGGLNRFDRETETFIHITDKDGLPNNVVYGVQADATGKLWLSTNKGLSRFDPETKRFRNFDTDDGLQSNEFNSGASYRSQSGELFFGGVYGFNYFRPEEIRDNPHIPAVVITGFRRGNRFETVRDTGTVLRTTISETDSLRLSYRDDVIGFEFAALEYSTPAKNRYAYRLVGFNDDWLESGPIRSATYTNLPPGRYTFEVKASNNDGVWNETGASLAILITPPWWQTWWAYAFYAALALSAVYGGRRYEMNRLTLKSRLAIEQVEAAQLRELDRARSRLFANVSHEFRTPLTLTLGPLDDLKAGLHGSLTPAMVEQVDLARRNAGRVLLLINEILELARVEAGETTLHARRLDLGAFVAGVARTFELFAERKGIAFEIVPPPAPVTAYADPGHLEKVVSNLLSNAFKFTPRQGAVRLAVSADNAVARISVRDSGPGIPAAERARVFDRFHRVESTAANQPGTGIGLALAKELVNLHGGAISLESEEGFGSTFVVALPLGRDHLSPEQIDADDQVVGAPSAHKVSQPLPLPNHGAGIEDAEVLESEEDITTVLVVEDNAEVRGYVRGHLAPAYRVLEAEDGATGLAMARRMLPDLVLSDVMMPGMDGNALCRAIKADPETDFIPVILLTARADPADRLAGLRDQADDYLTKPFDVRELITRIENLIAIRRRLRERFAGSVPAPAAALHPRTVVAEPAEQKFLDQVREAIETRLGDDSFSVEQLAQDVAHSRGHLHRRLRGLLSESPSDLIRRMRLERAAQLLQAQAGTVAEVAYSVGFKSVAHFSNAFKECYGVRPSGWRSGRTGQGAIAP